MPVVWVLALWIGAGAFKLQERRLNSKNPTKARASAIVAYGLGAWAPWLFVPLAVGGMLGKSSVRDFFEAPRSPWVIADCLAILVVYGRLFVWVWFQGGGEFLATNSDLMGRQWRVSSPELAKLVVTAIIAGGAAAVFIVLSGAF